MSPPSGYTLYELQHGKPPKPINRRKKINYLKDTKCPYCGAPEEYIYANNGSKGQCLCKVCKNTFILGSKSNKKTINKCPYCGHTLEKTKDRNSFVIYKCKNDNCKYYQNKLNSLTKEEKEIYKSNPDKSKLRYIYREFKFSLDSLNPNTPNRPKIDLTKAHNPLNIVGLIMTFYVNFGLSSRTVSKIMDEVFNIKVSHQTVLNYAQAAAYCLSGFTKDHIKDLSSKLCGDETYIKIKGKWRYIFFILNPVKKILISSLVSKKRDTLAACTAVKQVIDCFKEIPKDLTFIFDGNPIYLLAKLFFFKRLTF